MFGKFGDMGNMMKKALEMKKEMGRIKEEIADAEVKGVCDTSVEVILSGDMNVKSIKITPELIQEGDVVKVEEMVTVAVSNALEEAKKLSQQKMQAITGGLNIPGLFG
jgi:DNA-binding YbaB/EbfC family protein